MSAQIIATPPVTFQISAREFVDTLTTALVFASKDDTLPMINGVDLKIHRGKLVSVGTDRFRLALIRSEIAELHGADGHLGLLEYSHARKIIALMKPARGTRLPGPLLITIDGGKLTVDNYSERLTVDLRTNTEFPDFTKHLDQAMSGEVLPLPDGWNVNARYLAGFAAVSKSGEPATIRATTPAKPVLVTIGDRFLGLQMPTRAVERKEGEKSPTERWAEFLAPVKPVRKRAPRKAAPRKAAPLKAAAPKKRAPAKKAAKA